MGLCIRVTPLGLKGMLALFWQSHAKGGVDLDLPQSSVAVTFFLFFLLTFIYTEQISIIRYSSLYSFNNLIYFLIRLRPHGKTARGDKRDWVVFTGRHVYCNYGTS